jgi:hypothetical protein
MGLVINAIDSWPSPSAIQDGLHCNTGHVAAGTVETDNKTELNWVPADAGEDHRAWLARDSSEESGPNNP